MLHMTFRQHLIPSYLFGDEWVVSCRSHTRSDRSVEGSDGLRDESRRRAGRARTRPISVRMRLLECLAPRREFDGAPSSGDLRRQEEPPK